jgi:hypothetical protein
MQHRQQKNELASQLDNWTLSKQNAKLIPGTYKKKVTLSRENAELNWQVVLIELKFNSIFSG